MIEKLWPHAFTAAARGKRDRRRNYPAADSAIAMRTHERRDGADEGRLNPFEATIVADAEVRINRRLRRWEKRRHRLKSKAESLAIEIRDLLLRLRRLSVSREGRHDARRPARAIPFGVYAASLGLLGLAEYALNFQSFNAWFLAPDSWGTFFRFGWRLYLAAALPSVLLPLMSHLVGSALKHARRARMKLTDAIVLGSTLAVAPAVLYAMAQLRLLDLAHHTAAAPGTVWGILVLNLAVLVAGAALSYVAHSDDPDHEDSDRQERKLRVGLTRRRRRWRRAAAKHDAVRAVAMRDVEALKQGALTRIYEYRDHNLVGADQTASPALREQVGDRFFRPIDFSTELSRTPPTITDLYEEGKTEAPPSQPPHGDQQASDLNGGTHNPAISDTPSSQTEEDNVVH